ncbi:hypothetical protein CPB85DRAFT_1265304 [Mucidula mucida]|nr:hypothetical protein CPB85DRAFT_1265304 [Mucidula mucida]
MELGEWDAALRTAQKGTAMDFLVHLCETCNIKSSGTCWQYFRQWKQRQFTISGCRIWD